MFKITDPKEKLDPTVLIQAAKRFEWLTTVTVCEFKFVHQILMMMTKHATPGLGTMGVRVTEDGKFELRYDPLLCMNLSDGELTFIFYHEILHLALHHCTKRPLTQDPHEKHLSNIAHDLAINELIPQTANCQRPVLEDGKIAGVFVDELKKHKEYKDIEERQSAEWYWDYLRQKQKELGGLPHILDCDGDCANCKAQPGKPGQGCGTTAKKGCPKFDDHGEWKEHELADDKVTAKVKEIDRTSQWGDMSQGTRETIMSAQIKKVNWRNKIRVWFGNIAWKDRISTRKRPNRRTGFIHPGYRKSYTDKYLVAADTSGSVDAELLGEWIGVLNQLVETLPIDFMQFDCAKQTDPKPYDRRQVKLEFKGRGGTDFGPVMELVEKRGYLGVMILTDGAAAAPVKPRRAHVLWVLPAGCNPPVDWGDKVHLIKHS